MRTATVTRKTAETDITVSVNMDGGAVEISTGIGFFDHMLTAFAVHSGIGLSVDVKGDLYVDGHHTVEDTGIVLGKAIAEALGDKAGIARFGNFFIPMDESLCFAALDISGRPFLVFDARFPEQRRVRRFFGQGGVFFRKLCFGGPQAAVETCVCRSPGGKL